MTAEELTFTRQQAAARKRLRTLNRLRDARNLLAQGFTPDQVASDLETTTAALSRSGYRYAQQDVAYIFQKAYKERARA